MLNLNGLTPVGVRLLPNDARLRWDLNGQIVETNLDRFRPTQLTIDPETRGVRPTWTDFGDLPMTDPFFKFTMDKAETLATRSEKFQTDWDVVNRLAGSPGSIPFSGAMFHMARTGSTLIHRLLSRTGTVLSISEPPITDAGLRLTSSWSEAERNPVLTGLIAAYGRPRRPNERQFVVKMSDAMPNTRLPLFRAAFPTTPWIFIYRDPVEVMVSMLRKPTGNLENWYQNRARSAQRLGMPALASGSIWPDEFIARTLQRFCAKAVEAARATPPGLFLAVPYSRLPDAIWETIAPHFGIELTDREKDVMRDEARYSSKRTDRSEFSADSSSKRDEATPSVLELAKTLVMPVIEELKALPQA